MRINSPDRVSRAITNVFDNGRKWSPADGTIEVTLRKGPAFSDAYLAHAFDRFERPDALGASARRSRLERV